MRIPAKRALAILSLSATILLLMPLAGCDDDATQPTAPGDPTPQKLEIVGGQNLVGAVGSRSSEPIAVRVTSNSGVAIEGTNVVFAITAGEAAVEEDVVATDSNGAAFTYIQFGDTAGPVEATATAFGLTGSPASFDLMAIAADATQLVIISGNDQAGIVGNSLTDPIVVRAADAFGNPVEGAVVEFIPTAGAGDVAPAQVTTLADGLASSSWTLATVAGMQRVSVHMDGTQGFPPEFRAEATADVAARVAAAAGDNQGGEAGQALPSQLVAQVFDQYDNPVSDESVHFELAQGDGGVDPVDVDTDVLGQAATTLTLGTAGDHVVEASVGALAPASFAARSFPAMNLEAPGKTLSSVELSWTGAVAAGFVSYELRRSLSSPVDQTAPLVVTITDSGLMSHSDDTVEIGQRYFYRIFVQYSGGFTLATNEQTVEAGVTIELGGVGWDMVMNATGDRVYVSIPSLNEVAVVSTADFEVVERFFVGSNPRGVDLSLDGLYLFTALNGAGAVAAVDLSDNSVEEILIGTELGDDRTYDVICPQQDVVIVTSSPGSNGFAYVVRVDLDFVGGHTAGRIANNRIIRASPTLGMDPSGNFVYVGESFSPNSLYKLDMNTAGNPIVLEDDHGSVSGTTQFDVSPDGARIYLRSGQVIRAGSFNQAGTIAAGAPVVSSDGTRCFVGKSDEIEVFNTTTFLQVAQTNVPEAVDRMILMDSDSAILVLSDDLLYGVPMVE